jgi:uncharacterized protein (TIGR02466 family)
VLTSNNDVFLFQPYIWKFSYEFDLEAIHTRIENLFNLVEKNSKLEQGNAVSSVSLPENVQPHTWEELARFQEWLGEKLERPKDYYQFYDRMSKVTNSWMNRHYRGGYTAEHCHNSSTFVASCYLKCPPGSGNIEFKNPLEYHLNSWPIHPEEMMYIEVPVKTGDVLIFPGWLKHRVQPNNTDQERLVMTINIK